MNTKLLVLPLLLCLGGMLAGCNLITGRYHWDKPGATDADFKADSAACQAGGDQGFTGCMNAHGWTFTN
jgi:hypothetical protein